MKKIIPVEEGDYYLTPEGYRCFTERYHLKRGYCCKSGCRHCPYGYDVTSDSFKNKSWLYPYPMKVKLHAFAKV
jgi:hypothetical protein